MKKTVLIISAIAILGVLSAASRKHSSPNMQSVSSNSQAASASQANSAGPTSAAGVTQKTSSGYKNGTFTGTTEETDYGAVQIAVIISGGKITDVNFLQMPSDMGHSQEVTTVSEPLLKQSTLQSQSPNIDFVSGATSTSYAYEQSLQAALDQAKTS